jgi:4a-hydroxytetrahydrobiopterin dehydratase
MAEKSSTTEIQQKLKELNNWQWADNTIKKQFVFESFMPAVQFVNRVAELAEAADHHPDITINYRRVTLVYSTHSEGGLTDKDFDGAKMADACA